MLKLQLQTYRNKGINAYLAPMLSTGKPDTNKAMYGKPVAGQENLAHRAKKHTIEIDISNLQGVYIYKEAGGADGNKVRYGWLKIVAGEIIEEGEGYPSPQLFES